MVLLNSLVELFWEIYLSAGNYFRGKFYGRGQFFGGGGGSSGAIVRGTTIRGAFIQGQLSGGQFSSGAIVLEPIRTL